ncbi:MAG: nuclear transport factor 2 family protein [Bacteroidota bacterium]
MENTDKTPVQNADFSANLATIKGVYHAFATGDIPGFLNAMHPNIEWNEAENFPYADGNPYVGPDAIIQGVMGRIAADWEYWTITDQVYHVTLDALVIVTARYNAKHKLTGKVIRAQVIHMWTLRDGKIIKFQQYADTLQVKEAMLS